MISNEQIQTVAYQKRLGLQKEEQFRNNSAGFRLLLKEYA